MTNEEILQEARDVAEMNGRKPEPKIAPLTIERCKDPGSERVMWIEALTDEAVAWMKDVVGQYGDLYQSADGVEWKFTAYRGCDPGEVFEYIKDRWRRRMEGEDV